MRRLKRWKMVVVGILVSSVTTAAGTHGGGHGHSSDSDESMTEQMETMGEHMEEGMAHAHDEWVDPPAEYAEVSGGHWAELDAIKRGESIFETQCAACHGVDGQGTGPVAGSLAHRPADLTNHFHAQPGTGDAYLFWRVSEGGTVEPFRSQGSAMPAFKDILDNEQRWDVLAYIHTFFHQGLYSWREVDSASDGHSTN